MEKNILSGDINCLRAFRDLVDRYEGAVSKKELIVIEEKRLEKELNLNKKNLKDNIDATVKKRRSEVAGKYDQEIDKEEGRLRKIRDKRGKAKEKGVKARIEEETSDLCAQNKELKGNIRASLKGERLPKFCGSGFYFTLFFTKGAGEVFICALMIIIAFLLLPSLIYLIMPFENLGKTMSIVALALTFFVVIVIICAIYILISNTTKKKHETGLKSIRELRDRVNGNKKQIKKIAKAIRRDKNEDMYGLGDFDEKIRNSEAEIHRICQEKEAALINFDDTVRPEIIAEIEAKELPRIQDIENQYNETVNQLEGVESIIKETSLKISSDYEAYIGKDFSSKAKIDELIAIMEGGKAQTVSEAINCYKVQ